MVDSVHGSWTAGGAGHGGLRPWPAEGLTGARPSGLSGARWLTDDGAMESGARGRPSRTSPWRGWRCGDRATATKKRRWWCSVRVVLGRGKKRKRAGGGAVEDGGALPFYRGRGGRWLRRRNGGVNVDKMDPS
jgi:hypothetical protein